KFKAQLKSRARKKGVAKTDKLKAVFHARRKRTNDQSRSGNSIAPRGQVQQKRSPARTREGPDSRRGLWRGGAVGGRGGRSQADCENSALGCGAQLDFRSGNRRRQWQREVEGHDRGLAVRAD